MTNITRRFGCAGTKQRATPWESPAVVNRVLTNYLAEVAAALAATPALSFAITWSRL